MKNVLSTTVSELQKYGNFILNKVEKSKQPILVKYYGQPKAILLDINSYESLIKKEEKTEKKYNPGKTILISEEEYNELKEKAEKYDNYFKTEFDEGKILQWTKI